MGKGSRTLKTSTLSFRVIELLEELEGARVTEVAEELDIPPSTAHSHLATLEELGYVIKEGDFYHPSLEFLRHGNYVRNRKEEYRIAEMYTDKLHERTDCRSIFVVEEHGRGVFLHTASGERPEWRHEELGNKLYLHNTAVGKAILAEMPDRRVDEILERWGLPEQTDRTITDREELMDELDAVRERGYAFNRGENITDMWAVGVAVTGRDGQVVGAFSASGAAKTMQGDWFTDELPESVLGIANEFELDLSLM